MRELRRIVLATGILFVSPAWSENLIEIHSLPFVPQLDGSLDEWQALTAQKVALYPNDGHSPSGGAISEVIVRVGYHRDELYFSLEWPDPHEDRLHKPFVWDVEKKKYRRGVQREDRLALQFGISGDYQANWFASQGFVADMWHWKASRSDPLGLADDKQTTVSRDRLLRSARLKGPGGRTIYVLRQWDQGDHLYSTKRYRHYDGDIKPKYILNQGTISGSSGDIKAASLWHQGRWQLELKRKLNTGHDDDVVFVPGRDIAGAIAIFNRSESHDHAISKTLKFRLQP